MKIEHATRSDIYDIATLHIEAFPGFFLTSLGHKFLMELYQGFQSSPSGICLVLKDSGKLIGFVAGTTQPAFFFRRLRRCRGVHFLIKAIPAILTNPIPVMTKVMHATCYRGGTPRQSPAGALLSSIGVTTSAKATGISGKLIRSFEAEAIRAGSQSVYLTTDAINNDRVNGFYKKHGYHVINTFKQNNARKMFCYEKRLSA